MNTLRLISLGMLSTVFFLVAANMPSVPLVLNFSSCAALCVVLVWVTQ